MLVELWGEHDLSTVGVIDAALAEAARTDFDVVVDLLEVEFMDASTIRVLVDGGARISEHGHRLSLQAAHGVPRRLLDVCGLSGMIDSAPTTALEARVQVPKTDRLADRAPTSARFSEPDDSERSSR